jgi:uncharacterized protein YhaN
LVRLQQDAQQIEQRQQMSLAAWDATVKQTGVTAKVTPDKLRQVVDDLTRLNQLQSQHRERIAAREAADRQWDHWCQRLAAAAGDELSADRRHDPLAMLQDLARLVRQWEDQRQQVRRLRDDEERLQRKEERHQRRLRYVHHREQELLAAAGALDQQDLCRRVALYREFAVLSARLDGLEKELRDELADTDESTIGRFYEEHLPPQRQAEVEERLRNLGAIDQRLAAIQARRAEVTQQCQRHADQRESARISLQSAIVGQQIADAAERWRLLATISFLLKSVYKKYEKERQPVLLREASQYFTRLNQGHYPRIWSPLAEDVLLVDTADGRTLPMDQLSRGTRDQAQLCLRLALVSAYAKRGAPLPLILDDVLVNSDVARTEAAAGLLQEFARQGHQVIVMTCHQHVASAFRGLQADVRELPSHRASSDMVALGERRSARRRQPVPQRRSAVITPSVLLGYCEGDPRSSRQVATAGSSTLAHAS